MTNKTDKLRAVLLTALMLGSVFAAGIAFTGSAAAQADSIQKATHYDDADDDEVIEVVLDSGETVEDSTEAVIEFEDGDDTVVENDSITATSGDQRWSIETDELYNNISSITLENVSGSDTLETDEVTFAPSTVDTLTGDDEVTSFSGSNVALEADPGDSFDIEGPDVSRTRGTGDNSQVYVLDTDDFEAGEYNITNGNNESVLELRDLGLSASAAEDSYTDEDNLTAVAESDRIDRSLTVELLDSDGDTVDDSTMDAEIDSDGDVALDFGTVAAGEYTVHVTDDNTGVEAESDTIEVTEAADSSAEFVSTTEATRGDISTMNVSLTNAEEATITIGSADVNYQVNVTVEDGNEDGYVEFDINTYTMGDNTDDVENAFYVADEDSDDTVNASSIDLVEDSLSSPIADGNYRTTVRASDNASDTADDVSRLIIR